MRPTLRRLAEQQIQIEALGEAMDLISRQTGVDISPAKINATARTRAFASRADRIPEGNVRSEDRAAFEAVASTRRRKRPSHSASRKTANLGEPISSNGFSVDDQAVDAMSYLEHNHPAAYAQVIAKFPEYESRTPDSGWFDTEAMGVDVEWGSWLIDAIEDTGLVYWEEGEPWTTTASKRASKRTATHKTAGNVPSSDPKLRDYIGRTLTYRPDHPPYNPAEDDEPGSIVVGNGMDVRVVEVFENWNNVPGLIVFYVFVPETGMSTHFSAAELGLDIKTAKTAAPQRPTRRIRRRADVDNPANPNPEPAAKAPAISQGEAEAPQDTADLFAPYGEAASENVSADAVTDLLSDETVLDVPLDLDEDDVTVPVAGTTSNDSANKVEYRIEGDPGKPHDDNPAFPLEGPFAEQAKVSKHQARTFASLRLARLRIEAGIEPDQDDLVLGQAIAASKATDNEIAVEIKALDGANTASKRQARKAPRNLVPREATNARTSPSMVSGPASQPGSLPSMAVSDDEVLW